MSNPIPRKLRDAVNERDGGLCQHCGCTGSHQHHIVHGGTGRKRIHMIENLVTLCSDGVNTKDGCHERAHKEKAMRRWCEEWSRKKYGGMVDELLRKKWSGEK